MRVFAAFAATLFCSFACAQARTSDLVALQGTYVGTIERDEGSGGKNVRKTAQVIIERDTITLKPEGGSLHLSFVIDSTATPKRMDLIVREVGQPGLGEAAKIGDITPAIYELDGDYLILCWPIASETRPTAFRWQGRTVDIARVRRVHRAP